MKEEKDLRYIFKSGEVEVCRSLVPMRAAEYALRKAVRKGLESLVCYCPDGMIYGDYTAHLQRELRNIKISTIKKII